MISRPFVKDTKGPLRKLPRWFLLAVTKDNEYGLDYREKRSEIQIKKTIAEFERESVGFTTEMGIWGWVAVLEVRDEAKRNRLQITRDAWNEDKNPGAAELFALPMRE